MFEKEKRLVLDTALEIKKCGLVSLSGGNVSMRVGKDRYLVRAGDVISDAALVRELAQTRYHLVLANIVADVIIPLSARVPELLDRDGLFLCSGIIDTRAQEVADALARNGLRVTRRREKNGWVALEAVLS